MSALQELSDLVRACAERAGPSTVSIGRHGTGFVVGEGLVVTNAHNLRGDELPLRFAGGREEVATVRGVDLDGDLAVLAADTASAAPLELSSTAPGLGDVVVALAALGNGVRATTGTISALGRSFRGPGGRRILGGLEHTAPLARGSSGGPLLDSKARVVGVSTHRLEDGFYLAIELSDEVRQRIDALAEGRSERHRRLGVAVAPPRVARHLRAAAGLDEVDGLLVRAVEEDSPAGRAGLRRGDVLVSARSSPIRSVDDLHRALEGGDSSLDLVVVRATEELAVTVELEG